MKLPIWFDEKYTKNHFSWLPRIRANTIILVLVFCGDVNAIYLAWWPIKSILTTKKLLKLAVVVFLGPGGRIGCSLGGFFIPVTFTYPSSLTLMVEENSCTTRINDSLWKCPYTKPCYNPLIHDPPWKCPFTKRCYNPLDDTLSMNWSRKSVVFVNKYCLRFIWPTQLLHINPLIYLVIKETFSLARLLWVIKQHLNSREDLFSMMISKAAFLFQREQQAFLVFFFVL